MTHNNKQSYLSSELHDSTTTFSTYPTTTANLAVMATTATTTTTTTTIDHDPLLFTRDDPYLYTTTTPNNFTRHSTTNVMPMTTTTNSNTKATTTTVSGKTTELDQDSEIRSASRAAPCHLPPIQVSLSTDTPPGTQSSHTMTYTGYENDTSIKRYTIHPQGVLIASSAPSTTATSLTNASSITPSSTDVSITSAPTTTTITANVSATATMIDREKTTDAYLLFCEDQRENDNDISLDQQWNELPQTDKKEYHQRAIIINSKLLEEENYEQQENNDSSSEDKNNIKTISITTIRSTNSTSKRAMEHLVSPNAIREAEREENDELMGNNAEHHPFSGYPSILSMKQQDRRNSSGSHSASPPLPPTFSPDQQPYPFDEDMEEEDSPSSPSSSSVTMTSSMEDREENGGLIIPLDDSTSTTTAVYHHGYDMSPQDQGQHSQPPSGVKERLKRPPNAYLLFNRDIRRRLLEESPKMTVAEISKEIGERWKRLDPEQRQGYMRQAALIKQDHLKNHPDFIYTRRSKAQLAEARKFSRSRKGSHSQHHPNNNNGRITTDMNSTAHSTINMIHPSTSSSSISSSIPTTAGWPAATSATVTTTSTGTTTDYNNNSNNNNTTLVPHKRRRKSGMHDGPRDPRGRKKKRYRHPTAPKHPMSGFLFFLAAVRPEVARQYPGSTVGPISKVIASQWRDMTDEARIPWLQLAEEDKARYAREMRLYTATLEKAEEEEDASLSASEEQITPPDHPYAVVTTGVINMVNGHHTSSTTNIQHHHPSIHPLQQQQQQQHSHSMYDPVQLSQSIQLPSKLHTTTTTSSNSRMTNHNNNSSSSTSPTNYHYHPHHHHTHHHHHPAAGDMLYRSDSSRSLSTGYAVISGPNEYS